MTGLPDGLGRVLGCCLFMALIFAFLLGAASVSCVRACPYQIERVR